MKSTEHTAKAAVTPKIGRFATLRGLRRAQGSGASARGLVAAPLAALCVLLALCVAVAQAEPPKLIPYGLFGTHQGTRLASPWKALETCSCRVSWRRGI